MITVAEGSSPGIILASKFVSPGSEKYAAYIDYIDRDEAMRGTGYLRYTAYVDDYMDNPAKQKERFGFDPRTEKMTAIFTANKDRLTPAEKRELKKQFALAQKNKSPLWQHVLSFDNKWLANNGVLDQETMSVFQSTLPCGERPPHGGTQINPIMISIHAPLRGATLQKLERGKTWNVNFNPRSPAGSDGISKEIQLRLAYFNPRSPAGSDSS